MLCGSHSEVANFLEGSTPAVSDYWKHGPYGPLSSMIYRFETWWLCPVQTLESVETTMEYHLLGQIILWLKKPVDNWLMGMSTIEYHVQFIIFKISFDGEPPKITGVLILGWHSHLSTLQNPIGPATFCVDPWVHPGGLIASDGKGGAAQLEGTEVIFL